MNSYQRIILLVTFLIFLFSPEWVFAEKITGEIKVKGLRSLENILVFLSKGPEVPFDLSNTKFVMDQKNLAFIPHVLPILVGTTVHFPNNDEVNHNVFSLSKSKKFNLGSYAVGESRTVLFDKPGIIELRCDVHAEMAAYIMVMKNPYWAVTDKQGRFEIPDSKNLSLYGIKGVKDLPPGKYLVKTWHEKLKTSKKAVEVSKGGVVKIKLNLNRGIPGVLYK